MTTLNKKRSKSITITAEVRKSIESFKQRLKEMAMYEDETSAFDVRSIDIILNELDDYDRNIICAFYSIAECSPTKLGKYIGLSCSVAQQRIKRILKQIQKSNDVYKSSYNMSRKCVDY